jgi:hypothetical protein
MPSLTQLTWNFMLALVEHAKNGFEAVSPVVYKKRMEICLSCDILDQDSRRCTDCGCHMPTKAQWKTSRCPLLPPKWNREDDKKQRTTDTEAG